MAVCDRIDRKRYDVSHCGVVVTDFIADLPGQYLFKWKTLGAIRIARYTAEAGERLPIYGGWFNEYAKIAGQWIAPGGAPVTVMENGTPISELFLEVYYHTDAASEGVSIDTAGLESFTVDIVGTGTFAVSAGRVLALVTVEGDPGDNYLIGTTPGGSDIALGYIDAGGASSQLSVSFSAAATIYFTVSSSAPTTFNLYFV